MTLEEMRAHLRVDLADDDGLIAGYILAARQYAENYTRRVFVTQTWDATFDDFCDILTLPNPPLQSVTSITYLDSDGASQTLASDQYQVITDGPFGRILPAYGVSWPATYGVPNAVTVRYVAGYSPEVVPDGIRTAIMTHAELMYDRDPATSELLESVRDTLLDPYRVIRVL